MTVGLLTKLSKNDNDLRTPSVEGEYSRNPIIGESFCIFGKPLTEGALLRMVETSFVLSVEEVSENKIVFKTENSEYSLENM